MAKEHLGRYRNTMHCLTEVLKAEGPSALFIGLAPTLLRYCCPYACVSGGGTHHQLRCATCDCCCAVCKLHRM
jgi:solute carrier family 25 2-oxodicarboxylate transporter 21